MYTKLIANVHINTWWNRRLRRWSGSDHDLRFPMNASGVL